MIQTSRIKHYWTQHDRTLLAMVLCMVSFALAGCRQHYPGIEYDGLEDDIGVDYKEGKVPVYVAVNDPLFEHYTTRGVGAFDDLKDGDTTDQKWWEADFRVYAFLRRSFNGYSGDLDYTEKMNPNDDNCLCLIDDNGTDDSQGHGRKANLHRDEEHTAFLNWKDGDEIFYNNTYQYYAYRFFAYYLDDAYDFSKAPTVRSKDRISYDFTIDGTQDLMCGYASLTNAQIAEAETFKSGEKDNEFFADNIKALAFSKATGNRSIHPIFDMQHKLSYLKFKLKAGSVKNTDGETTVDPEVANVRIRNISISVPTKGTMTVAADDTSKVGVTFDESSSKVLYMPIKVKTDESGEIILDSEGKSIQMQRHETGGKVVPGDSEGFNPTIQPGVNPKEIGMGFLVPPAEEYALTLHCFQYKVNADGTDQIDPDTGEQKVINYKVNYRLKLNTGKPFREGYKYEVTIHVFGHQKIQLYLDEVTWGVGEDIPLDDEDDGEWEY